MTRVEWQKIVKGNSQTHTHTQSYSSISHALEKNLAREEWHIVVIIIEEGQRGKKLRLK